MSECRKRSTGFDDYFKNECRFKFHSFWYVKLNNNEKAR